MRRQQIVRRVRSGWFGLWLVLLIAWTGVCGWDLLTLQERAAKLSRQGGTPWQRAGTQIGVHLGYNRALTDLGITWLLGAVPLGLFMALSRGRTVIDERWVDAQGRPTQPPSPPFKGSGSAPTA